MGVAWLDPFISWGLQYSLCSKLSSHADSVCHTRMVIRLLLPAACSGSELAFIWRIFREAQQPTFPHRTGVCVTVTLPPSLCTFLPDNLIFYYTLNWLLLHLIPNEAVPLKPKIVACKCLLSLPLSEPIPGSAVADPGPTDMRSQLRALSAPLVLNLKAVLKWAIAWTTAWKKYCMRGGFTLQNVWADVGRF